MSNCKPRIAVTIGDCAGIGPELVLYALSDVTIARQARLAVYGSVGVMRKIAKLSGIECCRPAVFTSIEGVTDDYAGHILIDDESQAELSDIEPGKTQAICGRAAAHWITQAAKAALQGQVQALVTAPINKESLHLAGLDFPGHTEMLASLCGGGCNPCMSFYSRKMIVSLVTVHSALADVPHLITQQKIVRAAELTADFCRKLGVTSPRLGILGLNPHGGENGLFGTEEQAIIKPAIAAARQQNIDLHGPLVPDTAFACCQTTGGGKSYDAWIAMYHDQALIPFKMVAFDEGVNVTLGLPIIRTSPDHGTAFDLAWQGRASSTSFLAALQLAVRMCHS